jgi:DNA (cytosine-5)-methyltransferase 1
MYIFNQENGQLQRLRTQPAFRDDAWLQTSSGLILPVPLSDEAQEDSPEIQWQPTSSGIFLPVVSQEPPKPICISLFTGAGGFDLGFHSVGWKIIAATDYDTSCCWTYCYNMATRPVQMHFITAEDRERFIKEVVTRSQKKPRDGAFWCLVELDEQDRAYFHRPEQDKGPVEIADATPHYFLGDVRKLTGAMILKTVGMQMGEPDCITGGPPCQGFSVVGRREVMDPRNSLIFEFARLILEIRPRTFVFENVPGIVSMITPEGIPVLDAFSHMLADGGYASYEGLKRGLEHNLHSWGVVRDQGESKARLSKNGKAAQEDEEDNLAQMSLFEV